MINQFSKEGSASCLGMISRLQEPEKATEEPAKKEVKAAGRCRFEGHVGTSNHFECDPLWVEHGFLHNMAEA